MIINFQDYYDRYKLKVLAGRPEGQEYRKTLKLDEIDKKILNCDEVVTVVIPELFLSLNSSFFLGCFSKSIRNLGEAMFRERYKFECDNSLKAGIEDGISRSLNDSIV